MNVSIQRLDPSLPLPRYHTPGAAALDFYARVDSVIEPGQIALVPGNVIVEVPEGYALLILPRSSLPRKKALVFPHSLGLIDQDYHGPGDEIMIQVQNVSDRPVTVERGERIAQGLFVPVAIARWKERASKQLTRSTSFRKRSLRMRPALRQKRGIGRAATRGGFGSTG